MNLAYNFPIIFWNTANLIVDSAGIQSDEDNDEEDDIIEAEPDEEVVSLYEPEEWEEYEYEDLPDRSGKKKKKVKTVDYGRIATAIGKFATYGITVSPPNINTSTYTFTPVVETNTILYGLRGISRISVDLVNSIIKNRPYSSMVDFLSKVTVNKVQMTNLIKCGAFDELEPVKDRYQIMDEYIDMISEKKTNLTLQNMTTLIDNDLIPADMDEYKELFMFNKFLKKNKDGVYYKLTKGAVRYIDKHYSIDYIVDGDKIEQKVWDKLYSKGMEPMRAYLKANKEDILKELNNSYYEEEKRKYALGNISKWEMESLSFYSHPHELEYAKEKFDNFFDLPEEPEIENTFVSKKGDVITMYKLHVFAGTVLKKDKIKNTVTVLTQYGVVDVKIYKNQFAQFDKQISVIGSDGKKKVLEKSWLTKGNLLIIQGIRRGNNIIPKKYKSYILPVISRLTEVKEDGSLEIDYERMEVS